MITRSSAALAASSLFVFCGFAGHLTGNAVASVPAEPHAGHELSSIAVRLQHAVVARWPLLAFVAVLSLVVVLAARITVRIVWRRTARRGYWVRLTPPRVLSPAHSEQSWKLLWSLTRLAGHGWSTAQPPVTFEIYRVKGRLSAGLWLPPAVPVRTAVQVIERAWPGAALEVLPDVPGLPETGRVAAAAVWLAPTGPDTQPMVNLTGHGSGRDRDDGDVLRAVFAALADSRGPALVQVCVTAVPPAQIGRLRDAARRPGRPRRTVPSALIDVLTGLLTGFLREVLDLLSPGPSRASHPATGNRPADPLATAAMREAAKKLATGPHLLGSIRVAVTGPTPADALATAQAIADGYVLASHTLIPVPLRGARAALADRWVPRSGWVLFTCAELGVLAHLPTDPPLYGFATAARHRPAPYGASRAVPERATSQTPAWTRTGWQVPPPRTTPVSPPSPARDDGSGQAPGRTGRPRR